MKDRPFSDPMVKAILDGRRTVARRVVEPQPAADVVAALRVTGVGRLCIHASAPGLRGDEFPPCPFGEPGERLWLREKPRSVSRCCTLDVVSVRAERLHNITEDDAKAEGILSDLDAGAALQASPQKLMTARDIYRVLWDATNGKRAPWASNPWVWRIEFKRAEDEKR